MCLDAHTSNATPGVFADDVAHWTALTAVDTNQILQHLGSARNTILSDGTHPGRTRGVWLYAAAINALLNMAAAMPLSTNVRAGLTFGPDTAYPQTGTMPQGMMEL